jgi:hypothetical protein
MGVRRVQPIEFCKGHRLNHRKSFQATILQVTFRFSPVKAMKKFLGRIAQIKEGGAVGVLQEAAVRRDLKCSMPQIDGGCHVRRLIHFQRLSCNSRGVPLGT